MNSTLPSLLAFLTFLHLFLEPFGPAPMNPELHGLIATLRRGSPRWLSFTVDQIRAAYALPPGENCATPVGPAVPVRPEKGRRSESKLIFLLLFFFGRIQMSARRSIPQILSFRGEGEGGATRSF